MEVVAAVVVAGMDQIVMVGTATQAVAGMVVVHVVGVAAAVVTGMVVDVIVLAHMDGPDKIMEWYQLDAEP